VILRAPKHPKRRTCVCDRAAGIICGACFDKSRPPWEPPGDDEPTGDPGVDGLDWQPAGSWAE
jgi:hypothetical protein